MNKQINLILAAALLAAVLLGEVLLVLRTMWRVLIFTGIAVLLFLKYDDWKYSQRVGGIK